MKRKASVALKKIPKRARVSRVIGQGVKRMASGALKGVARGAVKALPYVEAAQLAYGAGKYLYDSYKGKKVYRGAKYSSYRGKFKKTRKVTTLSDKFINKGIVTKFEHGGVQTSTRQCVYVAHHTLPPYTVGITICRAIVKALLSEAKFHVKNDSELILGGAYYDGIVRLEYKTKDGGAIASQDFAVPASSATLDTVATLMMTFFQGLFSTGHSYDFLVLRFYMQYGTLANALDLKAELDLSNASVQLYGKSILKIQNRTVNSTGNDQADDVDNVPLQGRIYEYKGNGTIYRDYNMPTGGDYPMLTTQNSVGCLPGPGAYVLPSETATSFYKELPERTQFVGCYKMAPSVLDPGHIRTSTIIDRVTMKFSKVFTIIWGQSQSNASGTSRFFIGHSQLFGFEKKINAVAMTSENQFNVAYEKQGEIGAVFKAPRMLQTAPVIVNNTYQT